MSVGLAAATDAVSVSVSRPFCSNPFLLGTLVIIIAAFRTKNKKICDRSRDKNVLSRMFCKV